MAREKQEARLVDEPQKQNHQCYDDNKIKRIIQENKDASMPVAVICQTVKGRGVSFMEDNNLWHYRTPKGEDYQKAAMELEEKAL